jgi:signal transduction histidine kinase
MTGLWIVALGVGMIVAFGAGRRLASRQPRENPLAGGIDRFAATLERGQVPDPGEPELEPVRAALERAWTPRDAAREDALRQALGRIVAFLDESVEAPLTRVLAGDPELLKEGIERALRGLDDLDSFLREPLTPDETHDVVPLVQQVVREFIADWEVGVRFSAQATPVRAHIHKDTFLDAVYLLLQNAGHFSEWATVDVQIASEDGKARILIRDRGPGFSEEALHRARDLFYTTKPAGLGLGIPFARRIIEGFGGQLELRNRTEGGAEVLLTLPSA